ncbi:MAG: ABC transporter ATP-binding protein [Candidatus Omnitrophota bacterium]
MMQDKKLEVKNLRLSIGNKQIVDDVSFDLFSGHITALVGESGSGKTLTGLSILRLFPNSVVCKNGYIIFEGRNLFDLSAEEMRKIRGNKISMVFQEPFTAMNPVMRVSRQISETIEAHQKCSRGTVKKRLEELINMVCLSSDVLLKYPHELSGGMRQRAMLAMMLACNPEILILDEPTTALDVSVQKEILELINTIRKQRNLSVLFITHDFSVVNMIADDVCVMKSGKIVEKGTKESVLNNPQHEYTQALISCVPKLGDTRKRLPVSRFTG